MSFGPQPSTTHAPEGAKRPYLGAALLILSGLIIGYVAAEFTMELILIGGPFTAIGLLFAGSIILTGVFSLVRPDLSTFLGITGVALSILSVVGTLGGLFVGLLLGILGGNLLISWHSPSMQRSNLQRSTGPETRKLGDVTGFGWEENTTDETECSREATLTPPREVTPSSDDRPAKTPNRFVRQDDPYAREITTNQDNFGTDRSPEADAAGKDIEVEEVDRDTGAMAEEDEAKNGMKKSVLSGKSLHADGEHPADGGAIERAEKDLSPTRVDTDHGEKPIPESPGADSKLDDALQRVAHGAVVSFPSLIFGKMIDVAITTILTNGFAANSYGLYILAKRLVSYLEKSMYGFLPGINRFLPTASVQEKDQLATGASLLMLGIGIVFGAALFIAAPLITNRVDYGTRFQLFLRVFAIGLPGILWLRTINKLLEGLEEVRALNVLFRFFYPIALLSVAGIGTFLFHDFVVVAVGEVLVTVLITLALTGWLMRARGFTPRFGGGHAGGILAEFVRFSIPLVGRKILENIQGAGFYLLIIVFLPSVAGGVFAVGILVGSLVRLPLSLNNQFIAPVISDLHENDHRETLVRLYQVTTRLILVGITGLAIPLLLYRTAAMRLFGPTFVEFTSLLPIFILAQYVASVAGSVSILLSMTDHQRAAFGIEIASALILVAVAVPLTMLFGLRGLVVSYLVDRTVSNGLQMITLYYLEGYHPFTTGHLKPLLAALPFVLVALSGKLLLSTKVAPLVGTLGGLAAYGLALHVLGFTTIEHRLVNSLVYRYKRTFPFSG